MTNEQSLTYEEAGRRFGLSSEAIRQRARRLRWRTSKGNDGKIRVAIPDDFVVQPRVRPDVQPNVRTPVQPSDHEALFAAFRVLLDEMERRRTTEIEALKREREAAISQIREDHAAEVARIVEATVQQRQDHAAELERMATVQKGEVERLQGMIKELTIRPPWWARLLGKKGGRA